MKIIHDIILLEGKMLEEYINLLKFEVINIFKEDSSGHDIGHLERTMNNALFLQKS